MANSTARLTRSSANWSSRASGEGPLFRACCKLLWAAKTVSLCSLRVHVVVRERILGSRHLAEEALDLPHEALCHDGWRLVEIEPSDCPPVRDAHWHGIGTHRCLLSRCTPASKTGKSN